MDFQNILLIIAGVFNLGWVAFFLRSYFRGQSKRIAYFFIFNVITVLLWITTMFLYRFFKTDEIILFWCRWLYVAAILIPITFLYFAYFFPLGKKPFSTLKMVLISLPALILIALTIFSDTIIYNAYHRIGQENVIIFGSLYFLYIIYIIVYFGWSSIVLTKKYKSYTGLIRSQIFYILLGVSISSIIGMITNLILPTFAYFSVNWLGQVATVIWVSFTIYPIVRYRLTDIRVITRKIFAYLGISACVYISFYLVSIIYIKFFGTIFTARAYLSGLIITPVFVAIFLSVYRLLFFVANKYFFSRYFNYQETMSKLIKEINYSIDLQKIIDLIVNTIKQTMQLNRAGVLLLDKSQSSDLYRIAKVIGFNEQNGISLVRDNFLTKYLEKTKLPLVSDELILLARDAKSKKEQKSFEKLYEHMEQIEASLCLPLISNKKLIGIIVLGLKTSGDAFSKEDLELLDILANQASIAISNAQQHKEIQEFNATLKQKVAEQTKDILQKSEDISKKNQYLQELLNMKTDFLRVVNHQLNTPLSIMKIAYSMVKDHSFSADKGFVYAEAGLNRMDQTISDFWDAFQLEGEKMEMNPEPVDIAKMITSELEEKKKLKLAQERKLKLVIEKPAFSVPLVWCDPKRIIHVISNLLDNAVFYTAAGGVTVSYEAGADFLKVNIKDTGAGISDQNKEKIFQKFSRGVGATVLHPDGSGLGLYIAKKIVEGSDGQLTYASAGENKGSTFSFALPLYKNQQPVKRDPGKPKEIVFDLPKNNQ